MSIDLKQFTKTGTRLRPPKVVMMGVGGIGKTTFAAHAPNPFFLFTEEGQGKLDVARLEPRPNDPVLRTWEEVIDGVAALYEQEHDYGTVVLDTLDGVEPLLWTYTAQQHGETDIESFGYGKGYGYAVDYARVLLQGLEALRNDKNMAVILLAHTMTRKFESPTSQPYDRYQPRLQTKFANMVHDWTDVLLFANWRTHVVTDADKKRKTERQRGVGTGERIMYTEERPAWWAKNRYGLPHELPLDWQRFQDELAAAAAQPVVIDASADPVAASTEEQ